MVFGLSLELLMRDHILYHFGEEADLKIISEKLELVATLQHGIYLNRGT